MKLTANEVSVIQMALSGVIEDLEASKKAPFNPEARKSMKEIEESAMSALKKIATVSGFEIGIEPYKEGDEEDFFTKES